MNNNSIVNSANQESDDFSWSNTNFVKDASILATPLHLSVPKAYDNEIITQSNPAIKTTSNNKDIQESNSETIPRNEEVERRRQYLK